jgi:hypothetical protein
MQATVFEKIGKNAITADDGKLIYNEISHALKGGHDVVLNFAHVEVFASPFFNAAIGRLVNDFSAEILNEKLHFVNLCALGSDILEQVIENAKEYYKEDAEKRAAIDAIVSDAMGADDEGA